LPGYHNYVSTGSDYQSLVPTGSGQLLIRSIAAGAFHIYD
jgi:hypothetical protein